ncbi:helix-turn-helix transcriptional regulator [Hydrogenophaga pseudoflava]|uniref:helix-turn-helix transcriptional regulator n=1 Tax=Hydrogenophaga pseudoflava TaxID=47421 RepID=UPI0009FF4DC4
MHLVNPTPPASPVTPDRLLPTDETCSRVGGVSKSTLLAWVREGTFPAPIPLTPGGTRVAFLESQVNAWIQQRAQVAAQLGTAGRAKSPNPRARATQ